MFTSKEAEKLWVSLGPYFVLPEEYVAAGNEFRSPLLFENGTQVRTHADWKARRKEIQDLWHGWMGPWPKIIEKPQISILEVKQEKGITRRRIRFRWTPNEETDGYLLLPERQDPGPAVLVVFYEPETPAGLKEDKPHRDFALQLTREGLVTLSIGTREASRAGTFSLYYPDIDNAHIQPLSMLGYAAANAWHVLAAQPEVDPSRIGIAGHSFGGKWAMFASCLFERFACAAWSDPGIVFQKGNNYVNYWEPWYLGWHPRPWRKRGLPTDENPMCGLYPELVAKGRNLHELHALMAPRPFLVSGGSSDPPSRWGALRHSMEINRFLGYERRVGMTNRAEHAPNAQSNRQLCDFFKLFLCNVTEPK